MKLKSIITIIISTVAFINAAAQPAQVKKAAKSMFKLTTFTNEGTLLKTGYGVFISAEGECISTWEPFSGAASATIIDAQGRKYDVDCLIGANEIYNVAKFRVIAPQEKKMAITPIPIASNAIAEGSESWFVEYDVKAPSIKKFNTSKVETFQESLPYYIYEQEAQSTSDELAGSPFLNSMGELLGLMQPAKKRTDLYCPSALYAMSMTPTGLTANEATLRQTSIRVALPTDYNQAVLALMMMQRDINMPKYLTAANDFIKMFPNENDGYTSKSDYYCVHNQFAEADATMNECIANSNKKDEAHHTFSRLIYNKLISNADSAFTAWNLDKALEEINAAISINPLPLYNMQKGKVLFSQDKYQEAYDAFMEVSKSNMRGGECYYDAALCLQAMNAGQEKVIEMLDSAVACYTQPYKSDAAPYLLIRGKYYDEIDMPRKAVNDYIAYEEAMQQRVGANFYYIREQAEMRSRLYQQAINDIEKAILLNPKEQSYYAERALIYTKLNKLDEGISYAKECTTIFPDYGDGYAIQGLALILKGNKKEGIALLEKSQQLGSEMAGPLIEKYKK